MISDLDARVTGFIHELRWADLPQPLQSAAQRNTLDLLGALTAGAATPLAQAARDLAAAEFGRDQATVAYAASRASAAGAALANGMTIDAMDSHDGHRLAKGHAGAGVLPAALAEAERCGWSGPEYLTALVVGCEIALRAGIALHASAEDYHSSGAWVALGAAAVSARARGLAPEATAHALGIAEYYGPRSPMMRCIDHPSMVKDGAGWGSMTGVLAGRLADLGFTGAPAATVAADGAADLWADLGERWRTKEVYHKPYACCRWAQPAIAAALALKREQNLADADVEALVVYTFAAARRLTVGRPENTEQAQYSLPYAVAAAWHAGRLGPREVQEPFIRDEDVLRLADRVNVVVDPELEREFPARALAQVELRLVGGRRVRSPVSEASGGPRQPLGDEVLREKFLEYTQPLLGEARSISLLQAAQGLSSAPSLAPLVGLISNPP